MRRYAVRLSLLALAAACTATPPVPPTSGPPVPGPSPTPAASSPTFRPAASATDATASVAALATSPILGEYETVVADNPRSQTEPRYPFPGKYRLVVDTSGVRVYTPNGRQIPYELAGFDSETLTFATFYHCPTAEIDPVPEARYRWSLDGDSLTLEEHERDACRGRAFGLTLNPWRRVSHRPRGAATPTPSIGLAPGPLAPGRYRASFHVPFTFVVNGSWKVIEDTRHAFRIAGADPTSEIAFLRPLDPRVGRTSLIPRLRSGIVGPTSSTTLGGVPVIVFDHVAPADDLTLIEMDREWFGLLGGQKARFFIGNLRGTTLIVVVEASDPESFDRFLGPAETVLASVRFGLEGGDTSGNQ